MRGILQTTVFVIVLGLSLSPLSCGDEEAYDDFEDLPFGEGNGFKNPMADVQVGEWAHYKNLDGGEMLWKVVQVHPRSRIATVEETTRDPKVNKLVGTAVHEFKPNHMLTYFVSARHTLLQIYFDEIKVGGRTWWAICIDTGAGVTGRIRQWYSFEAPVSGLLRMERMTPQGPQVQTELFDWSGKDGK
jgi:hypothetical protein